MKKLYFCGFMGSGKSVVGLIVAQKLRRPFVDLDDMIEERAGRTIREIFETDGEPEFRRLETETLADISRQSEASVISLGGGAVCSQNNREIIHKHGILVYLNPKLKLLVERLKDSAKRPKLLHPDGSLRSEDELTDLISSMLGERDQYYRKADLTITISEEKPKHITAGIVYSKIIQAYPELT